MGQQTFAQTRLSHRQRETSASISQDFTKTRNTRKSFGGSTTPVSWIEGKNAHATNQKRSRSSAHYAPGGMGANTVSVLEKSWMRTPDFRDLRCDPEVRFVNDFIALKRKDPEPARRLEYPGRPLDSQGGTFSIPRPVVQSNALLERFSNVLSIADKAGRQTPWKVGFGLTRSGLVHQMRPKSAFASSEASRAEKEHQARLRNTARFGKCVVETEDPLKAIKKCHFAKTGRTWYW